MNHSTVGSRVLILSVVLLLIGVAGHGRAESALYPVKQAGEWGYVDQSGTFVISPRFDSAGYFSGDWAVVGPYQNKGYINRRGTIVIPKQYAYAYSFQRGTAVVGKNLREWQFIGRDGAVKRRVEGMFVLPPLAGWAIIPADQGKRAISFTQDKTINFPRSLTKIFPFINGSFPAWNGQRWVAVNIEGRIVRGWSGERDLDKVLIAWEQDQDWDPVTNGFAPAFPVLIEGQWGFVNSRFELVIEPRYDSALPFSEGLAAVEKNDQFFYIDQFGNRELDQQFQAARPFYRGLAAVQTDGQWGLIDRDGDWVVEPTFQDVANPLEIQSAAFSSP